jgi:hypothetical protein
MSLSKEDFAAIAAMIAGAQQPAEARSEPAKRVLPAQGKAQASKGAVGVKDVVVKDCPVSFRAVVSDYMLREGQGHRYSARWVAVSTNSDGKESVLKSNTIAVLDALSANGVLARIRAMVDEANKDAKLGEYAEAVS